MKVICLGDSLTYGYGVARAVTWTALLSDGADGPEVVNRGISGDTTGGMLARLETDVLAEKSDLVLLMGGSNDIFFGRDLAAAKCNMAAIVFQCMAQGRKVVLGIPFPVLEKGLADQWKPFAGGEEAKRLLGEYGRWLVEFGREFGIPVLDLREALPREEKARLSCYLDGIHLSPEGHRLVAEFLRKNLWKQPQ